MLNIKIGIFADHLEMQKLCKRGVLYIGRSIWAYKKGSAASLTYHIRHRFGEARRSAHIEYFNICHLTNLCSYFHIYTIHTRWRRIQNTE